jgi:hypothetical protein
MVMTVMIALALAMVMSFIRWGRKTRKSLRAKLIKTHSSPRHARGGFSSRELGRPRAGGPLQIWAPGWNLGAAVGQASACLLDQH